MIIYLRIKTELRKSVGRMHCLQYQVLLEEYSRAKAYDDTYLYQHRGEFSNVDNGYTNYFTGNTNRWFI